MKTFYNLNNFSKSRLASRKFIITIGVFDGVHSAHRKIIKLAVKKAKAKKLSVLLITFNPHPAKVLHKTRKTPLLISVKHRLSLFRELGIDAVIVMRFTHKLARITASDFIRKVCDKIHTREIVIGGKFYFGKDKKGSKKSLKELSKIYGYKLDVITARKAFGKVISSTWIRKLILKGELKKASRILLSPVTVLGTVVKGQRRGRFIGFPTANIDPHHEAIPPSGVYAVRVKLNKKAYKGIVNIGTRPTFKKHHGECSEPTIEAHILNFKKPIYGRDLEISFVKKIRNEKEFESSKLLREQIRRDTVLVRRILR